MGACASKSGDLKKVNGEPPLVVEDAAVAPPVPDGAEKANKADGAPTAAETTDPADVTRRRSLSDLLKEDAEASDGESAQGAAVKVVTDEVSAAATDETAGAPASLSKEAEAAKAATQATVGPSTAVVDQDTTAEQLTDDPKACQEPGGDVQAAEEATSAEGREVANGASASKIK